jgi:predicted nucleic acid-binding protein
VTHFYLDTSAVVKRYLPEIGTAWIRRLTDPAAGHIVVLGEITLVEVAAAIAAKHRASSGISRQERDDALTLFLQHYHTEYEATAIDRTILERAVDLTQRHRLRGYDAVQLATALLANELLTAAGLPALTFIAADDDIVAAASAEGLSVDNPNLHP